MQTNKIPTVFYKARPLFPKQQASQTLANNIFKKNHLRKNNKTLRGQTVNWIGA